MFYDSVVTFIDPIRNSIWNPIFMPISSHRGDGISSNSEKIDIVVQNIGLHACAQMSRRTYHNDSDDLKNIT